MTPEPFNGLSPAEAERLAMLAEEAGEIVQAVGKVLRHGYASCHPRRNEENRRALQREIADLQLVVHHMIARGDLHADEMSNDYNWKSGSLLKYAHHQED